MAANLTIEQWKQEYTKLYHQYRGKLDAIEKEIHDKAEALGMNGYEVAGLIFEDDEAPIG